jgi:hypothetical protein
MGRPNRRPHKPRIRGAQGAYRTTRSCFDRSTGCYQCSRRRIDCDRGSPGCQKCLTQNLTCSGYGTRYRFADDLFADGKAPGGIRRNGHRGRGHHASQTATYNAECPTFMQTADDGWGRQTTTSLQTPEHRWSGRNPHGQQECTPPQTLGPYNNSQIPPNTANIVTNTPRLQQEQHNARSALCMELGVLDAWTEHLFLCCQAPSCEC